MKEFIDKLISRLEEESGYARYSVNGDGIKSVPLYKAKGIVKKLAEEYKEEPWVDYETVRSNRVDCEVPSDYFEQIKEVWVIDEWTEETKVFKEAEENKGGWIPCSERLPENDMKDVLVWFEYFRYGEYNGLYQRMGISYTFRGDWSGFVNGRSGWSQLKILAWQPLPPEYKE